MTCMHARNHDPSTPHHSWCVINRQRKWHCWGGWVWCREEKRESHFSSCLPSRHTASLRLKWKEEGEERKMDAGLSFEFLCICCKTLSASWGWWWEERTRRMNSKMCTYMHTLVHKCIICSQTRYKTGGLLSLLVAQRHFCACLFRTVWLSSVSGWRTVFSVVGLWWKPAVWRQLKHKRYSLFHLLHWSIAQHPYRGQTTSHAPPPLFVCRFSYLPMELSSLIQLLRLFVILRFHLCYRGKAMALKGVHVCKGTHWIHIHCLGPKGRSLWHLISEVKQSWNYQIRFILLCSCYYLCV